MLPKRERLGRKDFTTFFRSGRRYHNELFTLIHSPHSTFHGSVVVPNKIEKGAVKRNTLRRRVYDILRRTAVRTSGVYIVLLKKPAVAASYTVLKESLESLLDKVNPTR